MIVENGKLLIS